MQKKLNIVFILNQFFYFSLYGSMVAFISVYLLGKGFSNSLIGLTLSIGAIFSLVIQALINKLLDQFKKISLQQTIIWSTIIILLFSIILYFTKIHLVIFISMIILLALIQALMGLINALAFIYKPDGIQINYGLGRGFGSFAYAIITMVIGFVVERVSSNYIPLFYILFSLLLIISALQFILPEKHGISDDKINKAKTSRLIKRRSTRDFIVSYRKILILLMGIILVFFSHTFINNFFIQIIEPIGGTNQTMGIAVFLAALTELPVMMNFSKINQKIPLKRLLQISVIFFILKHGLTYVAPNMFFIYIAQFLQLGSFAIALPALVEYVNQGMAYEDLVIGQSLLTGAMAVSSVLSSLLSGVLLDNIGIKHTMLIGVILTLFGSFLVLISLEDFSKKESHE